MFPLSPSPGDTVILCCGPQSLLSAGELHVGAAEDAVTSQRNNRESGFPSTRGKRDVICIRQLN